MTSDYKITVGEEIYLLMPPNNAKPYRYYMCYIDNIKNYITNETFKSITYKNLQDVHKDISVTLRYITKPITYYTTDKEELYKKNFTECTFIRSRNCNRLYTLDEKEILEYDIKELNHIVDFKKKQKEVLKSYVNGKLAGWNFRGHINI